MSRHIIYVEDDLNQRRIMCKWLSGYQVSAFDNPEEAFELAAEVAENTQPVDLFIFDIMMELKRSKEEPKKWKYHKERIGQGLKLAQEIKKLASYKETPMLFVSGVIDNQDHRSKIAHSLGATCMCKPIPHSELMKYLHDRLGPPQDSMTKKAVINLGLASADGKSKKVKLAKKRLLKVAIIAVALVFNLINFITPSKKEAAFNKANQQAKAALAQVQPVIDSLRSDSRFTELQAIPKARKNGILIICGSVTSEKALKELKVRVGAVKPVCEIVWPLVEEKEDLEAEPTGSDG